MDADEMITECDAKKQRTEDTQKNEKGNVSLVDNSLRFRFELFSAVNGIMSSANAFLIHFSLVCVCVSTADKM